MKVLRLLRWSLLSSVICVGQVDADPMPQDRAAARALFDEGRQLAHAGRYADACPKLEESERLDPGIGTLFNLADCYEHIGRTAAAWSNFLEVADQAKRTGQTERATIAHDRVERLSPRLAHLTVALVEKGDGIELRLDGTALGQGSLGAGLPVDPGTHTVEAFGTGKKTWSTRIDIADGAAITVNVPALDDDFGASMVRSPSSSESAPGGQQQLGAGGGELPGTPPISRSWQRPLAMGITGLGVVGVGIGAYFGLRARIQWSDAQPLCPPVGCDPRGYSLWQDSKSNATNATVAFAVGGGVAACGVALWITSPARPAQVGIAPSKVTLSVEF